MSVEQDFSSSRNAAEMDLSLMVHQKYDDLISINKHRAHKAFCEVQEFNLIREFSVNMNIDHARPEKQLFYDMSKKTKILIKKIEPLPPMKPYLFTNRNLKVQDQKALRNIPYLGEDADYDKLLEGYKMENTRKVAVGFSDKMFLELVDEFYETYGKDLFKTIAQVLPTEMTKHQLRRKYLKIHKPKVKIFPSIDSAEAESLPAHETLKAYEKYFCRRCFTYGCLLHKDESKPLPKVQKMLTAKLDIGEFPCGQNCHMKMKSEEAAAEEENARAIKTDEIWTGSDQSLFRVIRQTFGKNFCAIAEILQTKTCRQVFNFAQQEGEGEEEVKFNEIKIESPIIHVSKKRKISIKRSHVVKNIEDASSFKPCQCQGVCSAECPCQVSQNFCEISCACSSLHCSNRFPGCKCSAQCGTSQCPCFFALRECNPDLCKCKIKKKDERTCKNASLQRAEKKHLLLGISDIAGWGCFTKNDIEKDDLVSEYCGEVISVEEGERRGNFYDTIGTNYLFNLSKEYEIDATREGNKIRFCNHSDTPNCYAKIVHVFGDRKVGIFAKRKIKAGEELFFDYKYEPIQKMKFFKKKNKNK